MLLLSDRNWRTDILNVFEHEYWILLGVFELLKQE